MKNIILLLAVALVVGCSPEEKTYKQVGCSPEENDIGVFVDLTYKQIWQESVKLKELAILKKDGYTCEWLSEGMFVVRCELQPSVYFFVEDRSYENFILSWPKSKGDFPKDMVSVVEEFLYE